jgi:urea transport system permease protein
MRVTARLIVAVILGAWLGGASAQIDMPRTEALSLLVEGGFDDKARAIDALAAAPEDATAQLLQLLLDGDLYYIKNSSRLVTVAREGGGYLARDALDGADAGSHGRRDVKKVTINNTLRGQLREAIAGLDLRHPDPQRRLAAVREMTGAVDADTASLLQRLVDSETDAAVREAMLLAVAMQALEDADAQRRAMAVALLEESDLPAVRTRLAEVRDRTEDREYR